MAEQNQRAEMWRLTPIPEADTLLVYFNGKPLQEIHGWQNAMAIGQSFIAAARRLQEHLQGPAIARDQALLMRLSIPLGLSDNKLIQKEALHIAEHLPGLPSIDKPPAVVGTPCITGGDLYRGPARQPGRADA